MYPDCIERWIPALSRQLNQEFKCVLNLSYNQGNRVCFVRHKNLGVPSGAGITISKKKPTYENMCEKSFEFHRSID